MKKIIALIITAIMLAGCLAACGGNSAQPAATEAAPAETEAAAEAAEAAADETAAPENTDEQYPAGATLKVAMECAYAPYNWTQNDDSNGAVPIVDTTDYAYGYDIMMAKYIAEELGLNLEIYKIDWDSLPMAVQSGKVDCVIAGQSITSERLQTVDFSDPYYYASIVTLVKKDSPYAQAKGISDLAGAKATSQINTVWYDTCIPQIPDVQVQQAQEDTSKMLVALNAGTVDIVVTDEPTAMGACAVYSDFEMLDFTGSDDNFQVSEEEINIGISMKKGNTELCEKINKVLASLSEQDYKDWMNQAIEVQPLSE